MSIRKSAAALTMVLIATAMHSKPAAGQPEAGQHGAVWELGELAAGKRYPTTLSAENRCGRKATFVLEIAGAPWLEITGPSRLRVAPGGVETTPALVDLVGVAAGPHQGKVHVTCEDCPKACVQDYTELTVNLTVVAAPAPAAPSGMAGSPSDGPSFVDTEDVEGILERLTALVRSGDLDEAMGSTLTGVLDGSIRVRAPRPQGIPETRWPGGPDETSAPAGQTVQELLDFLAADSCPEQPRWALGELETCDYYDRADDAPASPRPTDPGQGKKQHYDFMDPEVEKSANEIPGLGLDLLNAGTVGPPIGSEYLYQEGGYAARSRALADLVLESSPEDRLGLEKLLTLRDYLKVTAGDIGTQNRYEIIWSIQKMKALKYQALQILTREGGLLGPAFAAPYYAICGLDIELERAAFNARLMPFDTARLSIYSTDAAQAMWRAEKDFYGRFQEILGGGE